MSGKAKAASVVGGVCIVIVVVALVLRAKQKDGLVQDMKVASSSVTPDATVVPGTPNGNRASMPPIATVTTQPAVSLTERKPAFVRAEDAGENFSGLGTDEVVRRLTESMDTIVQAKAAKVLGDRGLAGELKLTQTERAKLDEYMDKQVALTAAATGEERVEATLQIRRLWRLTAEKLIDSLGNKNMAIVEAAAKNLTLMRNGDIIQRIIARLKVSNDTQFKIGAILALGVMREKRECLVPDRMTLGDDESEVLATKVIVPVLTELQASETDARTLQMLKMAFQFLKNPPDARPKPSNRQ